MASSSKSPLRPLDPTHERPLPERSMLRSNYSDYGLGLERHNSHDSNASSSFTHRADPASAATSIGRGRGQSNTSFDSMRTNPRSGSPRRSGPGGHAQSRSFGQSDFKSSEHGVISPLGEDELHQVLSTRPDSIMETLWDGDVGKGVKEANHEDISPWLFQGESSSSSSPSFTSSHSPSMQTRRRRDTGGTQFNNNDNSFNTPERARLTASQSYRSLRPSSPPSATTSTSTLNGTKDTPVGAKKSRNPFGFLKKKSSSQHSQQLHHSQSNSSSSSSNNHLRPENSIASLSSRYGSNAANLQPLRPPAWLDTNRPLAATSTQSALSLRSHAIQPPALHPDPWHSSLTSRKEVLPAALSLEDELEDSRDHKKDSRRRIHGLRHHLAKANERSKHGDEDISRESSLANHSQSLEQEVELSLDMNFDQIDDIVDPNAARQRLQGSGTESLSSLPASPPNDHRSPNGSETGTYRTPSPSYSASVDRQTSFASTTPGSSQFSDPSLGHSGSLRSLQRSNSGMPSSASTSTVLSDRRPSQVFGNRISNVPRLSLAEAQNYQSLRKLSANLRDRPDGLAHVPSTSSIPTAAASLRRDSPDTTTSSALDAPRSHQLPSSEAILAEHRKGSIVSAHSLRSSHSGISPKTSYANLPSLAQERPKTLTSNGAGGWASNGGRDGLGARTDLSYQFPPPPEAQNGSLLGLRKSSASSGQGAASSWMAPDSWAVQPDKTLDYLRDDNVGGEEDEDEAELEAAERTRRGSSSGVSAVQTSSMFRTGSSDPFAKTSSISTSRRGTEESIDPLTIPPQKSKGSEDSSASKLDLLEQTNNLAQSVIAQQHGSAFVRPSSRGGAGSTLAAAGASAAAAAAGKLGLHRPSKHRNARPNTAGSIGAATRPSTNTLNSSLSTEDDSVVASIAKREIATLKRPPTANNQGIARNHFIRVYKTDSSFATLSCSLVSTSTEVQTILARKSLTTDSGAYRLFVRDKGSERPLGNSDKPAQLQRRRLLQAGYTEADGLEEMGRDDLSYLLRFVFRPDSVMTFDSESIGTSEHTFQHLDLQSRNLEMVPIFLYKHADWIVSLDLSGNPMSDLPLDFVQLCTSLRTLRLSNLALKRIPQSIRHSETLTHLDLSNNRIVELGHIGLDLIPELMSIKVQNNRLFDLPSYFAGISTLRYLNISNNRFETFPSVICCVTSLVDLDVSFNAITELPSEISRLVNLERLILAGNSIEALPASMSQLTSLRTIDLRRNLIQDVSPLLGLPKLQNVQAESNSIKSFEATLGPQLRQVNLGRNPLSKVRIAALTTCDLTSLDLSSTNMTRLDESLFPQLPALAQLTLDGNQFVVLPDSLGELKRLEVFSCNNNLLATLPESIGELKMLQKLFVHNNNLKTLPQSIWLCESLTSINVSSNLLESFPTVPAGPPEGRGDALANGMGETAGINGGGSAISAARKGSTSSSLTQHGAVGNGGAATLTEVYVAPLSLSLQKLRLGDNRLGDEVFSVLSHLQVLEVLNLSFNEIFEIPNFTLTKLPKLRELYMSGNQLSTIPADDLVVLQELRILHLNGNKLMTLPTELGKLKKLANLDVGNNVLKYNIANWHYDWNWNMNPELRYLNLSGNTRLEIKTKLSEMGGSRKSYISDFSRLTSLRLLGLMDVTMPLQSNSTPDESENRRVRTSLSQVNNMAYGIADALGKHDNLSVIDLVIPHFRKEENECVFGLFDGHGHGAHVGSRIAHHLAEWSEYRISWEFQRHANTKDPSPISIPDVLRRAFLRLQKDYADVLINDGTRKLSEAQAEAAADVNRSSAPAIAAASNKHDWRAGASAILAYVVDKTLYIANAGDALAVMSRNGGTAHLVSSKHEPFEREETERIRSAEGWVSLRGYVNDMLDISRSFGYFHLFPIVNAAPAVTTVQLIDSDEFVIIANRTLWRYVSYQTAVDIARTERNDPMIAAQKLRDFAISYGAEESIMVMVICVGDLFYKPEQRSAGMMLSAQHAGDSLKKTGRRFREELPGDRTLARLDREVAPPIGQVALVFTDIKNSTSLWETNNGMQTAMRLHNYLLRRQLRTIGGYEVKTEGDAFMVSFPSVSAALLWCFTVQLQLLQEDWPQEILESEDGKETYDRSGELVHRGLSVRMGIHWGRPVCEADPITRRMDYFGPMVNRAARISGAADGGQILASKDVIKELQGLLGTFDDSAANGDGSASPNLGKTNEELDEDAFRLLNPNVSRDVVLLRRMGFGLSQLGERRLKGLETPEMLWLVYPKQLASRMEQAKTDVAADATAAQVYEPTVQLLDIEEVKQIGMLCLRLEFLSNSTVFPGIFAAQDEVGGGSHPASPAGEVAQDPMDLTVAMRNPSTLTSLSHNARRKGVEATLALHPELLIYSIRDDATDEELAGILEQLTTRIQNAISSLTLNLIRSKTQGGPLDLASDPNIMELLSKMLASPAPRGPATFTPITSPRNRMLELAP
ncbi:adenylate cyclase [Testicularia cyperi]|uniref:Adenylate cyclase n=1 Tax=Testicularia cyperi TaxID=1882483 RepID=A0A317XPP8_9BASI|nr:adenylate cyclase [Testicularia cyperi]